VCVCVYVCAYVCVCVCVCVCVFVCAHWVWFLAAVVKCYSHVCTEAAYVRMNGQAAYMRTYGLRQHTCACLDWDSIHAHESRQHPWQPCKQASSVGILCCSVMHVVLQCDACCVAVWCMLCCSVMHAVLQCDACCVAVWCMLCCSVMQMMHVIHVVVVPQCRATKESFATKPSIVCSSAFFDGRGDHVISWALCVLLQISFAQWKSARRNSWQTSSQRAWSLEYWFWASSKISFNHSVCLLPAYILGRGLKRVSQCTSRSACRISSNNVESCPCVLFLAGKEKLAHARQKRVRDSC